ncbi:alcohol dehydrogenase catalytic domain-containing protein [Lacticaseibacillus thailandensis]|uniref:alcohol dehydrogenase catalytic domain-containing protein n=1 Tax=Lacticaseibacillus thailandensis TaxID=381741 RepID=UPI0006D281DA|nr:alcohol dehydrogenase catalytic domain-containing protein [Lacticaseibacillus thailandensis]
MHAVIARNQQLVDETLTDPTPLPHDVVVAVDAVAINPHDVKALARVTGDDQQVFGYDAVGRVVAMGDQAQKYQVGDRIMYAGSAVRPGAWAEQEAVDERLTALVPDALTDWAPLAGMPLTSLTAWEILFDKVGFIPAADANLGRSVLVLNGAGGVGSILSQLATGRASRSTPLPAHGIMIGCAKTAWTLRWIIMRTWKPDGRHDR